MGTTIDLTPILQAIIGLLAAIITPYLVRWIKSKTTNEQRQVMLSVVSNMVDAAEQIYGAGRGPEKLAYVVEQMSLRGYSADVAEIEAAVKTHFWRFTEELKKPDELPGEVETEPPDGEE